jgi:hypothetical protein
MNTHTYGFRIVGPCTGNRRLVDAAVAFAAYAACDDRAMVEREAYLSAFTFGDDFADHLRRTGSPKGFGGACWSPWLWFDIDRDDLELARVDAGKLATLLCERYAIDDGELLTFFSGSKGFHIGVPTAAFAGAVPSVAFNKVARCLAERLAVEAGVAIDGGVYDRVRAFRAPNSRHPRTGLHKRSLTYRALTERSVDAIVDLSRSPAPFEVPEGLTGGCDWNPSADWTAAAAHVAASGRTANRRAGDVGAGLNRTTLAFIRDGASAGDRHRLLYSASRNLGEFGCPLPLAIALLSEAALDSGLPPSDVRRQVECGIKDAAAEGGAA